MTSAPRVNYAVRPSKTIQRKIVFDALASLLIHSPKQVVYVGFGAYWFTDFIEAQQQLSPVRMVSIEKHNKVYHRARFNRPFANVSVERGASEKILPRLARTAIFKGRCPVFWLDYDGNYSSLVEQDIETVLEQLRDSLVLLVTVPVNPRGYGKQANIRKSLRDLFPEVISDRAVPDPSSENDFGFFLADLILDTMRAMNASSGASRDFFPAFRLLYKDSTLMATVGGFFSLPSVWDAPTVMANTSRCRPNDVISAPNLTLREFLSLRSCFPRSSGKPLPPAEEVGFSLDSDDLKIFSEYYREYPSFMEVYR